MLLFYLIFAIAGFVCGLYIAYQNRIKIHAPNSNFIRNIKFKNLENGLCYRLQPTITSCLA